MEQLCKVSIVNNTASVYTLL